LNAPVFLTEPAPPRGVALPVAAGIRRIVAQNPGPMTYHGTNTYLIDGAGGTLVVDPGPDDPAHVADVLAAAGGAIVGILLTHAHDDHAGAVPALVDATGAPVFAAAARFGATAREGMLPGGWSALPTPGHAADHLCFARADGVAVSGDHVMSFSTSVVIPPDGDMAAYMASLRLMAARADRMLLPGHGPPIADPGPFVAALLAHRQRREGAIVVLLQATALRPEQVVAALYPGLDAGLRGAATASVLAHLLKLRAEGAAIERDGAWRLATAPW
jgi:glyoxylase-like metal-dependent hydrolase (beta-lactamase superfamily II)